MISTQVIVSTKTQKQIPYDFWDNIVDKRIFYSIPPIIAWLKMLIFCENKGGMQGMPQNKGSDLVDEEMWVRMNSGWVDGE